MFLNSEIIKKDLKMKQIIYLTIVMLSYLIAENPLVIPRNHLVELALENAIQGDISQFNELLNLISKPNDYKSNHDKF